MIHTNTLIKYLNGLNLLISPNANIKPNGKANSNVNMNISIVVANPRSNWAVTERNISLYLFV